MEARNGAQVINAFVPLAEMFGYATDLRSKTQGRGNYAMEVDHYEDVPRNIAEAIVAKKQRHQLSLVLKKKSKEEFHKWQKLNMKELNPI